MKFSATVTLQYPTIFSAFSAEDYVQGLDWIRDSGLDGAELCISHYHGLDLGLIRAQLQERGLGCSTLSTGQSRSPIWAAGSQSACCAVWAAQPPPTGICGSLQRP